MSLSNHLLLGTLDCIIFRFLLSRLEHLPVSRCPAPSRTTPRSPHPPTKHRPPALPHLCFAGLNFADVFCCLGLYKAAPKGAFVPGLEFAGEVEAIAPTTGPAQPTSQDTQAPHTSSSSSSRMTQTAAAAAHPNLQVGDRVLGVTRFGAFATHVALDTAYLRPIPADWSYEQAAAFPVQTLTAAYGLFSCGGLQPGDAVLVQSAAGGVGLQALQICRKLGCAVLGLVGSQDKVQLLEQQFKHALGSPPALGPHGNDPQLQQQQHHQQQQQQIQQVTASSSSESGGRTESRRLHFAVRQQHAAAIQQQLAGFLAEQQLQGFNVVLDAVAGPYFRPSYEALQPTGRYVIFGAAALTPPPGASLQVGLGLLNPVNLLAAARLVWGWVNRPKLDVLAMPGDNKSVCGFNLIWLYNQQRLMAGLYATVERLQLPAPLVGHTYTWQQLPEALAFLQSGRSVGKVVVAVAPANAAAVPDA